MNEFIESFKPHLDRVSAGFARIDEMELDELNELRNDIIYLNTVFGSGPRMCRLGRQEIHQRVQMIQSNSSKE